MPISVALTKVVPNTLRLGGAYLGRVPQPCGTPRCGLEQLLDEEEELADRHWVEVSLVLLT